MTTAGWLALELAAPEDIVELDLGGQPARDATPDHAAAWIESLAKAEELIEPRSTNGEVRLDQSGAVCRHTLHL